MSEIVSIEWKLMVSNSMMTGLSSPRRDNCMAYVVWDYPAWVVPEFDPFPGEPPRTPWSPIFSPSDASRILAELLNTVPPGSEPGVHVTIFWVRGGRQVKQHAMANFLSEPIKMAAVAWPSSEVIPASSLVGAPDWFDRSLFPVQDVLEVMQS